MESSPDNVRPKWPRVTLRVLGILGGLALGLGLFLVNGLSWDLELVARYPTIYALEFLFLLLAILGVLGVRRTRDKRLWLSLLPLLTLLGLIFWGLVMPEIHREIDRILEVIGRQPIILDPH